MLKLVDCAERTEAGPKAQVLAQALRLALDVPDGVVVLPGEPLPSPEDIARELPVPAGGTYAVRSSALMEDTPGRSAAGLFLSRTSVPAAQVPDAISAVRRSGQGEAVLHYCGHPVPVPVLIQQQVLAARLGVLHVLPGGGAVIEERAAGEPEWGEVERRTLPAHQGGALLSGAEKLACLVAAPDAAAQIEYALRADGTVSFLQARPLPPEPGDRSLWSAPPLPLTYHFDREHNPDPLSAAQAGLVEHVEESGICPGLHQWVCRGYLYYARTESADEVIPPADLQRRFQQEVLPACAFLLGPLEAASARADAVPLAQALSAYLEVYRRYVGLVAPSISRARGHLDRLLRSNLGEGLALHADLLQGLDTVTVQRAHALWQLGREGQQQQALLAAYQADYGAFSPCWDVAVPCDDEQPQQMLATAQALAAGADPLDLLQQADERHHQAVAALLSRLPRMARGALKALLPLVRAALVVAEDDDALFFRAQRVLRRALLQRGEALLQLGELSAAADVFHLPLSLALEDATPRGDRKKLAREADQAREAARLVVPPERFADGQPVWALPQGKVLHGVGVPGPDPAPVRARALVIAALDGPRAPLGPQALRGRVLVLPALLPSWAPWLLQAAALVTDSGGALSHGATQAREGGVPAVLGTGRATRQVVDGDLLLVDAVAGRVYSVGPVGPIGPAEADAGLSHTGSFPGSATANGR